MTSVDSSVPVEENLGSEDNSVVAAWRDKLGRVGEAGSEWAVQPGHLQLLAVNKNWESFPPCRTWITTILLLLVIAAAPEELERTLFGTWKSNRDLTLIEVRKATGLTEQQRTLLTAPNFFGRLKVTFGKGQCSIELDDDVDSFPCRIYREKNGSIVVEYHGSAEGQSIRKELRLENDKLFVRIAQLGIWEVFTRDVKP